MAHGAGVLLADQLALASRSLLPSYQFLVAPSGPCQHPALEPSSETPSRASRHDPAGLALNRA